MRKNTFGEVGAEINHKGNILKAKAPRVKVVVDTTGAGDILAGAFLTIRARGHKPQTAIEKAVKLATKSVKKFGVENI